MYLLRVCLSQSQSFDVPSEAEKKDIGAIVGGVFASLGALVIGVGLVIGVLMKHGKIRK